jgi:chemotaxis protein MotB
MSAGKKKRSGHGGGGGQERWLLTYSDMITLLMVFFIVLYAMSEVDKGKYAAMASSLNRAFSSGGNTVVPLGTGAGDGISAPMPKPATPDTPVPPPGPDSNSGTGSGAGTARAPTDPLEGIGQALYADFTHDGRFTVRISERGLIISLAGSALFDSGKAEIKPAFVPLLDAVVERVKGINNDISVEGFTDSDPIRAGGEYASNWQLSTARANQVRAYLESRGVGAERMIVVGYGETRPVFSNQSADGKAKNRRVDVVILRNKQVIDIGQEINSSKP